MVQKNILASILINNFNNQNYLNKCIQSCLNQSYKNIEIIIFDDKSTDNSKKILKKYKRKNIKIIFNKFKKFKSGPLNQLDAIYKSSQKSKGKYIFLLDSDDYFLKNKVSSCVKTFLFKKKLVFLQDNPIYKYSFPNKSLNKVKVKNKLFVNHTWPYFNPTSTMVFRRDFLLTALNKIKFSKSLFDQMFFDARIFIFIHFFEKNHINLNKYLTIYNQNQSGDTFKNYKSKNKMWWKRRLQYHQFVNLLFKKNKKNHIKFIDYYFTIIMNFFYK